MYDNLRGNGASHASLTITLTHWLGQHRSVVGLSLATLAAALVLWVRSGSARAHFAAVGGGLLAGAGFLILFRHHASLGGLNVLVLWLQEKRGWRAGKLQMGIDLAILLAASPWLTATQLGLSVLGAVALNFALAVNHKPGRYQAV